MSKSQSLICGTMLLVALASSGCATFDASRFSLLGSAPQRPTIAPGSPTIRVEFQSASKETVQVAELPLEPGMTVQDAIDKTKAGKRFRRMSIDLMRVHAESGEPHKMAIAFDDAKNRASHSTNYALYAKDRLVVTENNETVIDDMLKSLLGSARQKKRS
ncbi:MAG TPA: hypothetical protein VL096_02160 [Pirellulaceae bacterium]|nr:hypothetical protein [Pirellulaceae bacterium]